MAKREGTKPIDYLQGGVISGNIPVFFYRDMHIDICGKSPNLYN